jgi:chromosome segregation ATPase
MAEQEGVTVEELQAQLERVQKAQAGSDRRVRELLEEKESLNADWQTKLAEMEKEKSDLEKALDEKQGKQSKRQAELDRKERVLEMALAKGIPPAEAFTLLGLDDSDDEDRLDAYTASLDAKKHEAADEFARAHGRKVQVATLGRKTTYDDLLQMPDREIDRMSDAEFTGAVEQGRNEQRSKYTLRGRILADLGRA